MVPMIASLSIAVLAACAEEEPKVQPEQTTEQKENEHEGMSHADMDHSSDGSVPEGMVPAENATYEVGDMARIKDGHMSGMEGAEATIVGAYDTIAYVISYTPTDGGDPVLNHKWVVQEELVDPTGTPVENGETVTVNADHMGGMEGVEATIDDSVETTVYMIDFVTTDTGEEIKNHKWVTEEELEAMTE